MKYRLILSHGRGAAFVPNGQSSSVHWQSDNTSRNCQLHKETPVQAASELELGDSQQCGCNIDNESEEKNYFWMVAISPPKTRDEVH